jgi:hypothetical protein
VKDECTGSHPLSKTNVFVTEKIYVWRFVLRFLI